MVHSKIIFHLLQDGCKRPADHDFWNHPLMGPGSRTSDPYVSVAVWAPPEGVYTSLHVSSFQDIFSGGCTGGG